MIAMAPPENPNQLADRTKKKIKYIPKECPTIVTLVALYIDKPFFTAARTAVADLSLVKWLRWLLEYEYPLGMRFAEPIVCLDRAAKSREECAIKALEIEIGVGDNGDAKWHMLVY